jgi:hypothetical protein
MTSWWLRSWRSRSIAHFGRTTGANWSSCFTKMRLLSAPRPTRRFESRKAPRLADDLHPYPLTRHTVHLCVDMQRLFFNRRSVADAVDGSGAASCYGVGEPASERTVFTRFIPPERATTCQECGSATTRDGRPRCASNSIPLSSNSSRRRLRFVLPRRSLTRPDTPHLWGLSYFSICKLEKLTA